jgi:hypothetical protein
MLTPSIWAAFFAGHENDVVVVAEVFEEPVRLCSS